MANSTHQADLFASHSPRRHALAESFIDEYPEAFDRAESATYFDYLKDSIAWQSAAIRIAGRTLAIPRLQCWVADPELNYAYSGIQLRPCAWTAQLLEIRSRVESLSGARFNAVLLNYYRDGNDSVAWHADDEPELGPAPIVASASFGASRPFELKHRRRSDLDKVRMILHDGSLIVMGKTLQSNWIHQLPKVRSLDSPRINLTFRRIVG